MPAEPTAAGRPPIEGREPEPTIADEPHPTLADEFGTVVATEAPAEVTRVAPPRPTEANATVLGTVAANLAEAHTEVATGIDDPRAIAPDETEFATMASTVQGRSPVVSFTPHPQARCGRYVLKHFYARGGMGEVWLAEDPIIGRSVALKRMLGDRPELWKRFRVEAQITGRLEHPGIVPVHELGAGDEGDPFYVMKFVQGRTLKAVIEEFHARNLTGGAREVEQVRLLQMFHSLCQTVAYAHSRGVLHRDLKPENVMLGPYGETILLDWGIAKIIGQPDAPLEAGTSSGTWLGDSLPNTGTHAGAVMGTPSYMSPEVAAGLNDLVDERSDIYLLGATLYEILAGRQPRSAKTVVEMIKKATHEPPPPPRSINPLVPRALDAICLKAMAHRKEDRYESAGVLAEDIERFIAGEPVSALREDLLTRAWRWARRHRKGLGIAAASVLIGGLALFAVAKVRDAERRRNEAAIVAERLKAEDQARRDVQEFRRLADEASFFAATTEPVSEHAPYYDPRKGEAKTSAALAIAEKWGPVLDGLAMPAERPAVKDQLHQLLLLSAYETSRRNPGAQGTSRLLATLDRAARLANPTAGALRLKAQAYDRLGNAAKADEMRRQADDPKTPMSAQDHFIQGERDRDESSARVGEPTDRKPWQRDPARTETAIASYRKALAMDPDHYWSRFQLGRCYQALGRFSEAVEALGACVATRPNAPWGYSALGLALAEQGRNDEAEHALNQAVRVASDARPARLLRGAVYLRQKRQAEALADFEAVLASPAAGQLVEAAYYRGHFYLEQREVDKALADFNRVVAAIPAFRPVYLDRPLIYLARGETARALADLDAYIALVRPVDPKSWELHGLRGRILRFLYTELSSEARRGSAGQAILPLARAELLKAIELGGQAPGVFDDLGAVMEHSGRADLAVAAYSQGLRLAPDTPKTLIKRAWVYEQTNQHEKASADFAAAARSDPENAEAHTGLGYVNALRKLPPDAQREADLAILNGGDDYLVLHNVACIYAALSETAGSPQAANPSQDVAVALLRRAVKLWKQKGTTPSEIDLMKGEPAFKPLRGRKDFQKILQSGEPTG